MYYRLLDTYLWTQSIGTNNHSMHGSYNWNFIKEEHVLTTFKHTSFLIK